jgi:hypothetical protein
MGSLLSLRSKARFRIRVRVAYRMLLEAKLERRFQFATLNNIYRSSNNQMIEKNKHIAEELLF